ncbi:MAG: hypothetical protein HY716_06410 [Planctomycetes bacterium]|nr:hypothetical protein [Planctomycetota bacterium]
MDTSAENVHLRHVLELCKSGSRPPVETVSALIASDPSVEPLLIDLVRSRALCDAFWAPLWAVVILGERRCEAALPALLEALTCRNDLIHEGVEFALLRFGRDAVGPILQFLDEHPGLNGRVHLYAVLACAQDRRALDYLIAQLRRDEECMGAIGWALTQTRDPHAMSALERMAARFGKRDPDLQEAWEAAQTPQPTANPLLAEWRTHWAWLEDEESETEPEEPAPEEEEEGPSFLPRCYDVPCPVCRSQLEYDTRDGSVKVVLEGRRSTTPQDAPRRVE